MRWTRPSQSSPAVPVRTLVPTGNTVRIADNPPQLALALIADETLTSQYWLNLLPLCADERMRFYITAADLAQLADSERLHVVPRATPSFLVLRDGYPIDALEAPLPAPGAPADPYEILGAVADRLEEYAAPRAG